MTISTVWQHLDIGTSRALANPGRGLGREKVNPFKPSGAKWLHYKVFKAILV